MKRNLTKNAENSGALAVIRSMHKNGFYKWNIDTVGDRITNIYIHSHVSGFDVDIPEETKTLIADMSFEEELIINPITHVGERLINDCVCFSVITLWDSED